MLRALRNYTKVIMIIVILFFVASIFAGYGLYARGGKGDGEGGRDYAVAEAGGMKIMRSELERGAARMAEQYGDSLTSADIPHIRKAALDGIVIQSELRKEIANRKIDIPKDEINAAYTKAMDSYPTREEFMEFIKRSGLTEKQIKEDIKNQLQMQKLVESLEKDVSVEPKEIQEFYNVAKTFLYKQPAGVMVNIATFRDKAAAEAAHKAIAGGAKWDAEIEKYKSTIEMATSYDKPMLVTNQMMQQKELSVLKDHPLNKITPVERAGENHSYIAIKRSKSAERVLPFDEVSSDVTATIKKQKLQEVQQKFYGELIVRANVKVLDASLFPEEKKPEAASADLTASEDKKN